MQYKHQNKIEYKAYDYEEHLPFKLFKILISKEITKTFETYVEATDIKHVEQLAEELDVDTNIEGMYDEDEYDSGSRVIEIDNACFKIIPHHTINRKSEFIEEEARNEIINKFDTDKLDIPLPGQLGISGIAEDIPISESK